MISRGHAADCKMQLFAFFGLVVEDGPKITRSKDFDNLLCAVHRTDPAAEPFLPSDLTEQAPKPDVCLKAATFFRIFLRQGFEPDGVWCNSEVISWLAQ